MDVCYVGSPSGKPTFLTSIWEDGHTDVLFVKGNLDWYNILKTIWKCMLAKCLMNAVIVVMINLEKRALDFKKLMVDRKHFDILFMESVRWNPRSPWTFYNVPKTNESYYGALWLLLKEIVILQSLKVFCFPYAGDIKSNTFTNLIYTVDTQ